MLSYPAITDSHYYRLKISPLRVSTIMGVDCITSLVTEQLASVLVELEAKWLYSI